MIIIQALLFIIIYVPLIIFNGFVITKLWQWFVVPQGLNFDYVFELKVDVYERLKRLSNRGVNKERIEEIRSVQEDMF
jgi:thymidylate kinase